MLSRFGLVLAFTLSFSACDSGLGSQRGYEPVQPIAFSHALHAGEHQIACLYCHSDAEASRHAGVPSVATCMNCHAQVKKDAPEIKKLASALEKGTPIAWTKVHRLPDHAFFSHASHVSGGVLCQRCHGPVETMVRVRQVETLSMGYCLSCHRHPPAAPGAKNPARAGIDSPTDCAACHR
jgi:hypothetical protein